MTTWTIEETKKNISSLNAECLLITARLEKASCFEDDPTLYGDILNFADAAQPVIDKVTRTTPYISKDSLYLSIVKFNNKSTLTFKGAKAITEIFMEFFDNFTNSKYPERELSFGIPDPLW